MITQHSAPRATEGGTRKEDRKLVKVTRKQDSKRETGQERDRELEQETF